MTVEAAMLIAKSRRKKAGLEINWVQGKRNEDQISDNQTTSGMERETYVSSTGLESPLVPIPCSQCEFPRSVPSSEDLEDTDSKKGRAV